MMLKKQTIKSQKPPPQKGTRIVIARNRTKKKTQSVGVFHQLVSAFMT
jgi:hypothetical protein